MKTATLLFLLMILNTCDVKATKIEIKCLYVILYSNNISKEKFIECISLLAQDDVNSDLIFNQLSTELSTAKYKDFFDPVSSRGVLPRNFDYYDFDSIPQKLHRYRAIKEVLRTQLDRGRVSDTLIIDKIQNQQDFQLTTFILHVNRNYSTRYVDFVEKKIFRDTSQSTPTRNKSLRKISEHIMMRANPQKYINEISKYILANHEDEIYSLVHHVFTDRTLVYLSEEIRNKLVENLFRQVQEEIPYYAYFDVLAIEDLTGLNFREEIFKQVDYSKNQDKAHQLIQQKAIKYYKENYK